MTFDVLFSYDSTTEEARNAVRKHIFFAMNFGSQYLQLNRKQTFHSHQKIFLLWEAPKEIGGLKIFDSVLITEEGNSIPPKLWKVQLGWGRRDSMRQLQINSSPINYHSSTLSQPHEVQYQFGASLFLLIKLPNGIELDFTGTPDVKKTFKGGSIRLCLLRSSILNLPVLLVSYPAVRASVDSRWETSPLGCWVA